ncbi:MAG: hypothetical protein C0392_10240 [Syntrophus sp. (in: bacteria)]|nr:hypothetical protein [Syntrophus sp. (in: bacteria)]
MIDFKSITDEDLYGMCASGDEGAWRYLYNYILKICEWSRIDDPEDMASTVTLELIERALKKVRHKDKFRSFVKVMTKNRIIDSFKSSSKKEIPMSSFIKDDDEDGVTPEIGRQEPDQIESLFRTEIAAIVDAAIEKLPIRCRNIIREYLNFKKGLYDNYEELSRVLEMPVPTISSSVSRCMKILVNYKEIKTLKTFA